MITLFRSDTICTLEEAKGVMAAHIAQLPFKISSVGHSSKILRYELLCAPINILAWLHNQKAETKIYWSDRNSEFEMGGIGIADGLKGTGKVKHKELFAYINDHLSADNPHLRYYGGLSFDSSGNDPDWQAFGTYQFIIPQFELFQSDGQTTFAFNIAVDRINKENIDSIMAVLEQLDFSPQTSYRNVPQVLTRTDFPNKKGWETIFEDIRKDTGEMKHEKIVLARKSVFDFNIALCPEALAKYLKDMTPGCFHFCFQFGTDTAFLGATPERLFKTSRKRSRPFPTIETEAIAGTRPRGSDNTQDKELENQLLNSPKDAREHRYVVEAIRAALEPLCHSIKSDEPFRLRKLKGSQHLVTSFEGELDPEVRDDQILSTLHPTPAVAGCPTQTAIDAIERLEPFHRGWYTGPVGYIGYDTTEFAVAIRSGLIHQNQLSLYAGAGIVEGSTSQDEWNEIENKISNFIKVFNNQNLPKPTA